MLEILISCPSAWTILKFEDSNSLLVNPNSMNSFSLTIDIDAPVSSNTYIFLPITCISQLLWFPDQLMCNFVPPLPLSEWPPFTSLNPLKSCSKWYIPSPRTLPLNVSQLSTLPTPQSSWVRRCFPPLLFVRVVPPMRTWVATAPVSLSKRRSLHLSRSLSKKFLSLCPLLRSY